MKDFYKTLDTESTGYFKDKGSKFYAYAFPLQDESQVKNIIFQLKKEHHSARHHCFAWQLGTEEIRTRTNDDGEPSSTAGKPILGQIQKFELTNILIVVVRYFGGTLLGVSGLINAYKNAAADVLNNAAIQTKTIERRFQLHFTYNELNGVMQRIKQNDLNVVSTNFEETCSLVFSVKKSQAKRVLHIFEEYFGVTIKPLP